MNIRVQHEDGTIEVLWVIGRGWQFITGNRLNRLTNGVVDYFFTPDGYYDGWGGFVVTTSNEDAAGIIKGMESKRVIKK